MLDIFGQFGRNLGENAIRQNTDFQLQYKLNETEHILKFEYVVYRIKDYAQLKNGGHRTCPTFSFWVLKVVKS